MRRTPALLTLLTVVLALTAFLLLRRPPPIPPPVVLHPTAAQSTQARRHLAALQRQFQPEAFAPEGLTTAAAPPQQRAAPPKPRTLRLSEDDLNVYLADDKSARKMLAARGVKAVQIILSEPASLTIRAAVLVKGQPQNVQLDGRLAPDPKLGLRFTATRAQVGRFPLPPAVVTAQANALAAHLVGQMHGHLPLTVQSVRVQGKMLVLTGLPVRRPRVRPPAPASLLPVSPAHR